MIVYIDGKLADMIGKRVLREIWQIIANCARESVDIITHGESKYHGDARLTLEPKEDGEQ